MKKTYIILSIAFGVVLAAAAVFIATKKAATLDPIEAVEEQIATQPILEYGIPVDSFNVQGGTIKRNQTIGTILGDAGCKPEIINQLPTLSTDAFSLRQIRAGNSYKIFLSKDSLQIPTFFVYEHTPTEYVVFTLTDSLSIRKQQKPIRVETKLSEAKISSSLWASMSNNNLNPMLALDLSDVFAWTVDFFGIQQGDGFKVYYDELYVDSTSVGIGTIHAAWFDHRGTRYYAYRYMQDSTYNFWDEEGNSLKKAFLKAPLKFSRISSKFTNSRLHPVLKVYRPHTGVDYAAPEGTPIMAIGDGTVIERSFTKAAGNFIKIKHNSVYTTAYLHLSRFGKNISVGTRVSQGQVIGYVGKTGYATGPHLDFRFWKNGKAINPLTVESPSVEPIKAEGITNYKQFIASLQVKLDSVPPAPVFPSNALKALYK
ncbi:MAG: peptidoglycan DD-metalloendopeptidase family protein [Bacteroidales bacterium]|nr:peptidoglycan DD-metalloendopeptidase family protein [Bacteroidales bacterium]MBN2749615.1 peptidoglycan DD-metalloendopeptidase family protein [Bacteroidales bacterium]